MLHILLLVLGSSFQEQAFSKFYTENHIGKYYLKFFSDSFLNEVIILTLKALKIPHNHLQWHIILHKLFQT